MLDDLRNSANQSFLYEEDEAIDPSTFHDQKPRRPFLGMTAAQRFFLSLMLLLLTSVFGALVLLVTEKIMLP